MFSDSLALRHSRAAREGYTGEWQQVEVGDKGSVIFAPFDPARTRDGILPLRDVCADAE